MIFCCMFVYVTDSNDFNPIKNEESYAITSVKYDSREVYELHEQIY